MAPRRSIPAALRRAEKLRRVVAGGGVLADEELAFLDAACRAARVDGSRLVGAKLDSIRIWHSALADPSLTRRLGGSARVRLRLVREIETLILRLSAEPAGWRAGTRGRPPSAEAVRRSQRPPAERSLVLRQS